MERKEKIIGLREIKMNVVESGEGEPILFLHGFPECWYSWRYQLRGLSDKFRCIAPDLRGFGKTDKPPTGYDIETLSSDVMELSEKLSLKNFILCGHDWGGVIAWDFVYRYQTKVKALIVMNAPHPLDYIKEIFTNPFQFIKSWYVFFFQIPYIPERILGAKNYKLLSNLIKASIINHSFFTDDDVEILRKEISKPFALKCGISYYRNAPKSFMKWRRLYVKKLNIPIGVIWGKKDKFLSVRLAKKMAEKTSGKFILKILENSGHWVQQECPDEVNRLIREFVEGI